MAKFQHESVSDGLERALKNATHLRAKHAGVVAAARAIAAKIDAWDQIAQWAREDADEFRRRPTVPSHDNVSPATFLKYLDALGLTADADAPAKGAGRPQTKPDPVNKPAPTDNKVIQFQRQAQET